MALDWSEHPEAREEYLDALARYAAIADGSLGEEFADTADAASDLTLQWPGATPPYRGRQGESTIRTWHLGKFPYRLAYTVQERRLRPRLCSRGSPARLLVASIERLICHRPVSCIATSSRVRNTSITANSATARTSWGAPHDTGG